ncbi:unnamed protein product [Discula destructiva]
MQLKLLAPLALAGTVLSQALTDVIAGTPDLSTLGALLQSYPDLASMLASASNITILAPNNAAFSTFLTAAVNESITADPGLAPAVLSYHVLAGTIRSDQITDTPAFPKTMLTNATYTNVTGGQVVKCETDNGGVVITSGLLRNSTVVTADVAFNGGVVHIIDSVLTIPESPSMTATAANLSSLVGALNQTNLVGTVDEAMDVTILAPENSAFESIASLVSTLSTEQVAAILRYHVVGGTVGYSTSLSDGQTITTLNGSTVTITERDGNIFVNSAEVVMADILVSNGVAHVIDNVLNPGNSTTTPGANATTGSPGFTGATPTGGAVATPTGPMTAGVPMQTAAIGVAALFAGAALLTNL